ncbi:HAD-IA family hydrolase [Nocardia sp. R6R-6]|uniref:HAD-IA family hydrolase n=1 Tax=Nocardia sp. R6R-6 TaxID=3459303 RepID=UPI00403DDE79
MAHFARVAALSPQWVRSSCERPRFIASATVARAFAARTTNGIEAAFVAIEVETVRTARQTSYVHSVIRAAASPSHTVAIVSNNSATAIQISLDARSLEFAGIFARSGADVQQLKPTPYLLQQAINTLGVTTDECVFVGDSITDIQAAHAPCHRIRQQAWQGRMVRPVATNRDHQHDGRAIARVALCSRSAGRRRITAA